MNLSDRDEAQQVSTLRVQRHKQGGNNAHDLGVCTLPHFCRQVGKPTHFERTQDSNLLILKF